MRTLIMKWQIHNQTLSKLLFFPELGVIQSGEKYNQNYEKFSSQINVDTRFIASITPHGKIGHNINHFL